MITGSIVETIDAVGAPTRAIPSRKVLIGSTVHSSAIATIHDQPAPLGADSAPLTAPVNTNVSAAPVVISALNSQASTRATMLSAVRMYTL